MADSPYDSDEEGKKPERYRISEDLYEYLRAKGHSDTAIKKSIIAGCINDTTCDQWLALHEGHPDLETPLEDGVDVEIRRKKVLTEEEREAKVAELKEKIRAKKEAEKEKEKQKAKERLEDAKLSAEAQRRNAERRRQLDLEERQRAKAAAEEERRRIQMQIFIDRFVRQGKSEDEAERLAEEEYKRRLAEEVKERERQLAAFKAAAPQETRPQPAAASASTAGSWNLGEVVGLSETAVKNVDDVFASSTPDASPSLEELVKTLRASPNGDGAAECVPTLRTIIENIIKSPFDLKVRSIRIENKTFQTKVAPFLDALRVLQCCGFELSLDAAGNRTLNCTTVILRRFRAAVALLQ